MVIMPIFLAILGILAAIAIPNFVKARGIAQGYMCINNLEYIDQVKQMYAPEHNLGTGSIIPEADNNKKDDWDGIPDVLEQYFDTTPKCPNGGKYTIGPVGEKPTCSISTHILKEQKT